MLSAGSGGRIFLKLEHPQPTGSFKFRGATNRVRLLTPDMAKAGVVTASNGNHGPAVAVAAHARGVCAEVFVSSQVSPSKLRRIEQFGTCIRRTGGDPLEASLHAMPPVNLQGLHLRLQPCRFDSRPGNHRR